MPEQVNKFLLIILLVLTAMVLVLLFWEFPQRPAPPPSTNIPLLRPEASFEQEVDNVPLSDLETDFRQIEADLNSL